MNEEEANKAPPIKVYRYGYVRGAINGMAFGSMLTLLLISILRECA